MTAAVSRDLTDDFYPYFESTFDKLKKLLMCKDSDQLEWTLICIAHIFKAVKKSLKRNIAKILPLMMPLLSEQTPIHITNFVAECFAFIIRDLGKKEEFFILLFATMSQEHILGCSRLLFEMLRGVGGNMHLDAKHVILILLEFLLTDKTPFIFPIFVQITTDVMENIKKQGVIEYANALTEKLGQCVNDIEKQNSQTIHHFVNLWGQMLENSKDSLQDAFSGLTQCVFKLFDEELTDETLEVLSKLCQALLLCKRITLSQTDVTRICKKCMSIRATGIVAAFVDAMKTHEVFDTLIMPDLLRYVSKINSIESMQMLATVLIDKGGYWKCGIDMEQNGNFPTYAAPENLTKIFIDILTSTELSSCSVESILSLICLPHVIQNRKTAEALQVLKTMSNAAESALEIVDDSNSGIKMKLFLLHLISQCRLRCKDNNCDDFLLIADKLQSITDFENNVAVLRLLDLLLTSVRKQNQELLTQNRFEKLRTCLCKSLSSPVPELRHLSAHIYCQFNNLFPKSSTGDSVYDIILSIESMNIDIFNYREVIVKMDRFRPNTPFIQSIEDVAMKQDILRFLLGVLFRNFKLLWEPTMSLIVSYNQNLSVADFWTVFKEQLEQTMEEVDGSAEENDDSSKVIELNAVASKVFNLITSADYHSDLFNCHYLLWTCLSKMPSLCDTKNREIVPLYLSFYEETFQTKEQ